MRAFDLGLLINEYCYGERLNTSGRFYGVGISVEFSITVVLLVDNDTAKLCYIFRQITKNKSGT